MLYEGHESYTFFKDNEEDIKDYKNLNLEQLKTQGFIISENKKTIKVERIFRLKSKMPVLEADFIIINEENPIEE